MYPKWRFRAYIGCDIGKFLLILSNLAKIIKNWKVLPCAGERFAPGVVQGESAASVVGEEVACIFRATVTLDGHVVDGHRRDGAGAVAGREGDVGVPLCA